MKHFLQVHNAFMLNDLLQQGYVHKTTFASHVLCSTVLWTCYDNRKHLTFDMLNRVAQVKHGCKIMC